MLRVVAFCLGVCLSASAIARAENSANQTQTLSDAEQEARLKLFVKTGNQARLAGAARRRGDGVRRSSRHSAGRDHQGASGFRS